MINLFIHHDIYCWLKKKVHSDYRYFVKEILQLKI